ncbi:MAG: histidinol dehydrogenase [bacterium]|nr:histidinol dehydrogenase [bacterium]MCP4968839.1 histidinol dehydrogenase [bacterium]
MNIKTITLAELDRNERNALLQRSAVPDPTMRAAAATIVDTVRSGGDAALATCNESYGGGLPSGALRVPPAELQSALTTIAPPLRAALEVAAVNIRKGHQPQRPVDQSMETIPGVRIDRRWTALRRIGVYVPGGRAAYPSSLLMGVIPAQIAGVGEVVVTSPADEEGNVSKTMLAAAALLGITEVYITGGAQAIGALAYGTETIRPVDKIVGPGNAWVTAAKLAVYGDVGVDLPAGPSEALVVADATADPRIIAADLMCQAEHGPESPVALATPDRNLATTVLEELDNLLPRLERNEIIKSALSDHGLVIITESLTDAIDFANEYAAEHLSVHTANAEADATLTTAAGSVFVGHWAPESAGDYATGANHVLPTGGLAAAYGPLSVEDCGSWRQVQTLTEEGLATLRPTIASLADAEGLTAHKLAVEIRFEDPR